MSLQTLVHQALRVTLLEEWDLLLGPASTGQKHKVGIVLSTQHTKSAPGSLIACIRSLQSPGLHGSPCMRRRLVLKLCEEGQSQQHR